MHKDFDETIFVMLQNKLLCQSTVPPNEAKYYLRTDQRKLHQFHIASFGFDNMEGRNGRKLWTL